MSSRNIGNLQINLTEDNPMTNSLITVLSCPGKQHEAEMVFIYMWVSSSSIFQKMFYKIL